VERIAGIDYGQKRIGLAISDPLQITAQPVSVLKHTGDDTVYKDILEHFSSYDVIKIIVGLPLNMDGSESETSILVREFASELETLAGVPVEFWDERLSSRYIERLMIHDGVRRKKRRKQKDMMEAVVILQNYLDFRSQTQLD